MSPYPLVVVSAFLHAYWNFVLKRRGGTQLFVGLSKVSEVVVFAPVFIAMLLRDRPDSAVPPSSIGLLVVVGAGLTLANYFALARAYQHGDLSVVYPLSRGAGLLFLPPLGFLVFGERLSPTGWMALGAILAGLVLLQRRPARATGAALSMSAVWYALFAGLAAAGYTIWDKRAVGILPAFLYFYAYSLLVAVAYGAFLLRRFPREAITVEWRAQRYGILQVGVCNTIAYVLVLLALRTGTSSYVIALRQLSIVIGVALGVWRFGERMTMTRLLGASFVLAGCALVAIAW